MAFKFFQLGDVVVPVYSAAEFNQSYRPLGGAFLTRMLDGTGVKQTQWQKLSTEIRCSGTVPPALQGLDYSTTKTLKCAAKRSIHGTSEVIVLPANRRSDTGYEPVGYAITADRLLTEVNTVSLVANTITLATEAGAIGYMVDYYPELTVWAFPPDEQTDVNGCDISWTLRAEEV